MTDRLSHILNTSVEDGLMSAAHVPSMVLWRAYAVAQAEPRPRKSLIAGLEREIRKRRKSEYQTNLVAAFNGLHRVGTLVRAWPGTTEGPGIETKTRSEAQLLSSHTAVVWVDGVSGCIALEHVEVIR